MSTQSDPATLGIRHAAISVSDLDRAIRFYTEVFGFLPYHVGDPDWAMLVLGDTSLSLIRATAPTDNSEIGGLHWKNGSHYSHFGITVADRKSVDVIHRRLAGETNVGRLSEHRDGSYGFYLRDPDGNPLECIFIPLRSHAQVPPREAWVFVAREVTPALRSLPARLRNHLGDVHCEWAFLGAERPSVGEVLTRLAREGVARKIRIFSIFLSRDPGMAPELDRLVETLRRRFPHCTFEQMPMVGDHWLVQEALLGAIVRMAEEQ